MADAGFNGSTISLGGAMTPLRSIDCGRSAAKVQVSGGATSPKEYVAGNEDVEVSFTIVGATTKAAGDTGAIVIAWFDGETDEITNSVVVGVSTSGSEDSEILTTITCVPTPAA